MVKSPRLTSQVIAELGVEKLAQIALDAAQRDVIFKKHLNAALAGSKGSKAIIAMIDRRLSALEKARSSIDWDKTKAFAQDLRAAVDNITNELGSIDPEAAIDRLLRFIATSNSVFNRVDDSNGTVQRVYETALYSIGTLSGKLSASESQKLPLSIMTALAKIKYEYLDHIIRLVINDIPTEAIKNWDGILLDKYSYFVGLRKPEKDDWNLENNISVFRECRQIIAEARGDLDGVIALETTKKLYMQNNFYIAKRLLEANRPEEALVWIRKKIQIIENTDKRDLSSKDNTMLEASILDKLNKKNEAQMLRWDSFCQTLNSDMLREHIKHLDDFAEFEVLDRAFNHAYNFRNKGMALYFLINWPKLDYAAKLVMETTDQWDRESYRIFDRAAAALKQNYPVAATILYRLLVSNIVSTGNSQFYKEAAKFLSELANLAPASEIINHPNMKKHEIYYAELFKANHKKRTFWELVKVK